MVLWVHRRFPSPIGVFLFILENWINKWLRGKKFPSPIGVFLFILNSLELLQQKRKGFRPLSGSFFLSYYPLFHLFSLLYVSVPYRGLSFYLMLQAEIEREIKRFPSPIGVFLFILHCCGNGWWCWRISVPYRGLSFYLIDIMLLSTLYNAFRPLSGSFFLSSNLLPLIYPVCIEFPSPIGVFLFIFVTGTGKENWRRHFRPLSGSFFLSCNNSFHNQSVNHFRPLSGSFFLSLKSINS